MKRFALHLVAVGLLFATILPYTRHQHLAAATGDEQSILQSDHEFVRAVAKDDKNVLAKLLDEDFTWTDAAGKTQTRSDVLKSLPTPAIGPETGATIKQLTYGQVGAVMADREKLHTLRVWVKRPAGWRAIVYQEVAQAAQPASPGGTGVKECENPCKSLPYRPRNEAEQGIVASWQALETGVTNHDSAAWSPHIADEFVMVGSSNDHPLTKADRMATLDLQKQTGSPSAPAPLVSAQMFDFGDSVVMTCLHQPYSGKRIHVSRVWIKRNAQWIMAISYQTAIQ
jgi:hypothetical protein